MSDTIRTRIAEVQRAHMPIDYAGGIECTCGGMGYPAHGGLLNADQLWAEHVADAVIEALGLQTHLEKRIINGKPDQWVRRHVTDWEIVDE